MPKSKKADQGKKAMFAEAKKLESKGLKQELGTPTAKATKQIKGKELDLPKKKGMKEKIAMKAEGGKNPKADMLMMMKNTKKKKGLNPK